MYQFLVGNLETQLKEMMTENLELKKVLGQMKTDMCTLLGSSPSGMEDGLFKANPDEEQAECDIDQAEHSCGTVKEQLLLSIRKQWRSLKNRMEKLGSQGHPAENEADHVISITDHDKEIARLKQEIEQSREVICLQQQLLQNQQAALNPTELPGNLRGCYFLEEQEQLKHDREIFEFQKKQFENERRNFTEAAIRLGHDKQLFEEERAQLLKHHFLSMTPLTEYKMTPFWKQRNMRTVDINNHENTSQSKFSFTPYLRHCSARMKTPFSVSRTNHPVGHEGTPTTGELYRVLQLAPHTRSTLTRRDKSCVRIRSSSSSTTISAGVLYKDTACQTLDDQFHDVRSDLLDCFLEQSF
ncbi:afadin- and alpha-actinin-binding protein B-like [Protopterus annectens]|uniref:afadin- and alpha-actinin-binding protein B-like n=1 Tax=Protopterus annectens TaxID=7888 RepID=UPI001CFB1061|nr:afadin- and alpha-actinin-binding protein B-like [Protopterus annectens]